MTRISGRDFTIPTAKNTTTSVAAGIASRAHANQLQAELHLRDLEVKKLAVATAEARRERDEERQRANRLENEIQRRTSTPHKNEEEGQGHKDINHHLLSLLFQPYNSNSSSDSAETAQLKRHVAQLEATLKKKAEMELTVVQKNTPFSLLPPLSTSDTTTTATALESMKFFSSNDDDGADETLAELRKEANALRQQVEMAAAELQGQRARADAAEERVRLTEARVAAAESSQQASEAELRSVKQKLPPMGAELRRLAKELASAEDRAALAERSLTEERARASTGSGGGTAARSKAGAVAEVALTAQVRALQSQLRAAQGAAATARQELISLRAETQGHASSREGATAELLCANRELAAAVAAAIDDLDSRGEELRQARAAMAQLSQENAALHAALQERTQSYSRAEAAELHVATLQQELKSTKTHLAQLEDAMARNGGCSNSNLSYSSSPSPLRDVVGSLRTELQDRELRLAAADEDLVSERLRAAELHRQVLDQAVEIDELQRVVHQGDGVLREDLRQARAEVKSLTEKLAAFSAGLSEAGEGGDENENRNDNTRELMQQERDALRRDLEEREAEVMVLQGQLHLMMTSRDGEVENWLTGP